MIVLGDFNSTPLVESQRRTSRAMLRRLQDEFGLVSAYHSHLGILHGQEPHPTFFMNRRENRPFHIDYCFVPEAWVGRINAVEVGRFSEWPDSDHRPLLIELSV
jgi:endonuclease/exonuclease/phosphatase family metal-dependent hydrolase